MTKWKCVKCDFVWSFPAKSCIRCGTETTEVQNERYIVKAFTEVNTPSLDHTETPYQVLMLEDSDGNLLVRKSFSRTDTAVGTLIEENAKRYNLPVLGLVGTGITGKGIAQVALLSGCEVILKSRSEDALYSASKKIEQALAKRVNANKLKELMGRLTKTTDISALIRADIVIEAVTEDLNLKRAVFEELDRICKPDTVLCTNTSSLPIEEIAARLNHPDRVIGLHFFNPIPKMRLVEIVHGEKTSQRTQDSARDLALALNKFPVTVKSSPGFIVNRLLFIYLNEAISVLEEELASTHDIDRAIELGLNHPMGPFRLLDLIGIDVFIDIMENLDARLPGKYKTPEIVKEMFGKGLLGRKTCEGFYKY